MPLKVGHYRPAIEIRTSIAKEPYIFVIFQGGSGPLSPPLDPHMCGMS